jgi:hypothetical protein
MDDINVYKKRRFHFFCLTVFFSVEILLVNLIRPLSGASVNESNIKWRKANTRVPPSRNKQYVLKTE